MQESLETKKTTITNNNVVNDDMKFPPKGLELATEDEAIGEAVARMRHFKLPASVIENFKEKREPDFCMENGKCAPLSRADRRMIKLLNAAGYLVYAVLRSNGSEMYKDKSLYVVLSSFKTYWDHEREHMENDFSLAYVIEERDIDEFRVVKLECLPDGMLRSGSPGQWNECGTDASDQTAGMSIGSSEIQPYEENEFINADEIDSVRRAITGEFNYFSRRPSADFELLSLFDEAPNYVNAEEYACSLYLYEEAYRLAYDVHDFFSFMEDLYIVSQGTIGDIILRSGLTQAQFCTKLGIDYNTPYFWDSGEGVCHQYYRFLMGKYLGIIREPSFIRDEYSYIVERVFYGIR